MEIFKKAENIFVLLCLIIGLLFIIITPPFCVSDENSHMFKMWAITEGTMNFQKRTLDDGNTYAGTVVPKSLYILDIFTRDIPFHLENKFSLSSLNEMKKISLDKDSKGFVTYFVPQYGILSYMPGIIVLEIMKWLDVGPLYMLYILRFISLITYMAIMYFAIKIMPIKKWLFALCALTPTAISLAAGISTDGLTISLMFLFTALVFNFAFNEKISKLSAKDIVILGLILLYITILKFPYGAVVFLLFVIPKEKFPEKFSGLKTISLFTAMLFLYTLFTTLQSFHLGKGLTSLNPEILPVKEVLLYTIKHPAIIIQNILNSISHDGLAWYAGSIAIFSWQDTVLPPHFYFMWSLVMLSIAIFADNKEPDTSALNIKNKWIYFLVISLCIIVTYVVCYFLFSYEGLEGVRNMQGRYFIPTLPLFYLLFATNKKINLKGLKIFSLIAYTILILDCILNIVRRFYL